MLASVSALDVALAGVIATALVGVLGPTIGALVARGNRAHEQAMIRDKRTYEAESAVYEELMVHAQRHRILVNKLYEWQREPTGPDPGVPDLEDLESVITRGGRIATFGSSDVLAAYQRFIEAATAFARNSPSPEDLNGAKREELLRASDQRRKQVQAEFNALGELVRTALRR